MNEIPTDAPARRRVLRAAAAEFAANGFDAARLGSIAAAARVDLPELLRLVRTKADLYALVLLDVLAQALAAVGPAVATAPSPAGRLRAAVTGIAGVASENPHFAPLLLREIASGGASLPRSAVAHMQLLLGILTDILTRGAAGGVFRAVDPLVAQMALAGSLLVVVSGAPIVARLREGRGQAVPSAPDLAAAVADLLLDGVRPPVDLPSGRRRAKERS